MLKINKKKFKRCFLKLFALFKKKPKNKELQIENKLLFKMCPPLILLNRMYWYPANTS